MRGRKKAGMVRRKGEEPEIMARMPMEPTGPMKQPHLRTTHRQNNKIQQHKVNKQRRWK
jgi:hypothetical protein